MAKSKRTKAVDITQKVKKTVWERDKCCCIICGVSGYGVMPNAHFIPRSKGGLGIEQNIVTLCMNCHHNYDKGSQEQRSELRHSIRNYLQKKYTNWDDKELLWQK